MKVGKFKLFLIFPAIYISGIFLFMSSLFNADYYDQTCLAPFVLIMLALHLFAMFCIFYTMYFVAKTIKTAEEQKELRFSDFVGEFFLIWFYPIGVWILQLRINAIHEMDLDEGIESHLVV